MHRLFYRQTPRIHRSASLGPGPVNALPAFTLTHSPRHSLTVFGLVQRRTPQRSLSFTTHLQSPPQRPSQRLYHPQQQRLLLHSSSNVATAAALPAHHPSTETTRREDPTRSEHGNTTCRSTSLPTPPPPPTTGSSPIPPLKETSSTKRKPVKTHEWDPELDALMIALHEAKVNWRTIGKVLERPFTTIYTRYLKTIRPKLDLGWRPDPIMNQPRFETLLQQALATQDAAAATLKAKAVEAKLASQQAKALSSTLGSRPKWDSASDQMIIDLVSANKSWPEIGTALNRPYPSCYTRYFSVLDPVLQSAWTPEMVTRLTELAKAGVSWKDIGRQLQLRPLACRTKWSELGKVPDDTSHSLAIALVEPTRDRLEAVYKEKNRDPTQAKPSPPKGKVVVFSREESAAILSLVERHGEDQWDLVLEDFRRQFLTTVPTDGASSTSEKKTSLAKKKRLLDMSTDTLSHHYVRLNRKRYLWTFDEETVLIQKVLQLGTEGGHWDEIAKAAGLHSPEECRAHWKQLDMPVRLNPVPWSKVEQGLFWTLWKQFGSDFEKLARFCPRRSANDCQTYFEHATRDFSRDDPETFARQVDAFQENLPSTRLKYIFTKERSLRLQHAVQLCERRFGTRTVGAWRWIASKVQRGLPPSSCIDHWLYLCTNMDPVYGPLTSQGSVVKPEKPIAWSHAESMLLDQGIRELGSSWTEIQQRYLPWRNTRALRQRWLVMSDRSTRVNEDEYYTIVGAGNETENIDWESLTEKLPGWKRSPCRRVFETSYKHLVRTTVWSPEEDRKLVEVTLKEGGRDWNTIARHFSGIQPAMAPLYNEAMERFKSDEKMGQLLREPQRTHKSAWQCRLRWCQLMEPLVPKDQPMLTATEKGRQLVKLSRKLFNKME